MPVDDRSPDTPEIDDDQDYRIEDEQIDPNLSIEHPFNPEEVRIHTQNPTVDNLVVRIRHEEMDLAPDFQRLRGIWKDKNKSRLIESLLLRIPLPVFYVSADDKDHWAVVDGIQRMAAIYEYVEKREDVPRKYAEEREYTPEFALQDLEYLTDLSEKRFKDLPRPMQRRIRETQLTVHVIQPGTPEEVMFNVFSRINTGGTPLNGQEIRHALYKGAVRGYLKKLTEIEEFRIATGGTPEKGGISDRRMADRECVLRFLAFYINPWKEYPAVKDAAGKRDTTGDLDGYLRETMKRINRMTQVRRDAIEADFRKAMRAADDIFEGDAFRKPRGDITGARRNPINKALLEAWAVHLARLGRRSPESIEALISRRRSLRSRFNKMIRNDQEFFQAITASTGDRTRVQKRFGAIGDLIRERVG